MKKVVFIIFTLLFQIKCIAQVDQVDYANQVLKAAEEGDVRAILFVAEQYYEGKNTAFNKDIREARKWYEKAAEQGSAEAEWALFWFDYKINGTWYEGTLEKAFPHLVNACKMGFIPAIFQYSKMHYETEDYDIAVSGFNECVKAEFPPAFFLLASCYYDGLGVTENIDTAMDYFSKAIDGGIKEGFLGMAYCYLKKENYSKAIEYFKKAIDENVLDGYNGLAYMYAEGKGMKVDFNEAHRLIDIAITKDPMRPNFYDSKGKFYLMEGQNDKAKEMWNKVLALDPKANAKNSHLAMAMNNNVDNMIPKTTSIAEKTYAVIIANQEYKRVSSVPFAKNDGLTFAEYCKKTLGLPDNNVFLVEDATLGDIKYYINHIRKILDAHNGEAKLIFYYAGHGIPDEKDKSAYLLPSDGYANDPTSGFSLKDLYDGLEKMKARSVIVFLDACFSGSQRDGDMLESARGVVIKPKLDEPKGQVVVFSASQGDETAHPYKEMGHGLFTYFLLKKLQETKGDVNLGELADYITSEVKKQSISINGKIQTPIVSESVNALNWKSWKLY